MTTPTLLNVREVCARLGVCRSTLYKRIRAGQFPKPLHVTPTAPRWREDELADHIERLSESRAA